MSTRLDRTLRSLDAANPALTEDERIRADALLDRILETTEVEGASGVDGAGASVPRTAPLRRLVLVPTAVAALVLAILVFPGDGGGDPVYASWTPTPTAVDDADLEAVTKACTRRLAGTMDLDDAELALAERRGDHVALLYRTDDPDMSGSCLATIPADSGRVQDVMSGAGGSSGPAMSAPPTGFTQGAIAQYDGVSITDGAVGEEVVAVTIHAGGHTIETTVRDGRYVAWWPGAAFEADDAQPSGEGGPGPILVYDLTLADGTVITDAQPAIPD